MRQRAPSQPPKTSSPAEVAVCNYPGAHNVPKGVMLRLFPQPTGAPTLQGRLPPVCIKCGAYINPFCETEAGPYGTWTCSFCGFQNAAYFTQDDLDSGRLVELTAECVDYVRPLEGSSTRHPGQSMSPSGPPAIIFVLDRDLGGTEEVSSVIAAIEDLINDPEIDPATPLGLIVFGRAVSLYRVGMFGGEGFDPACIAADVLDGRTPLQGEEATRVVEGFAGGDYTVPLYAGKKHLVQSLYTLAQSGAFRPASSSSRCLGHAIRCCLLAHLSSAKILVFTTGAPTSYLDANENRILIGEESNPVVAIAAERLVHYKSLSLSCRDRSMGIDIFCLGLAARFESPCLLALASFTGGQVLMYPSALQPEFPMDLQKCVKSHYLPPDGPCVVDLRISRHMSLTSTIGPGELVDPPPTPSIDQHPDAESLEEGWSLLHAQEKKRQGTLSSKAVPAWSGRKRLVLGRVPQDGQAVDVMVSYALYDTIFGVLYKPADSHIFSLQVAMRVTSSDGKTQTLRVMTHRIDTKMTSHQHSVMAVMAVKRAVLSAVQSQGTPSALAAARKQLDNVVHDLLEHYPSQNQFKRTKEGYGKPCGTEFKNVLRQLYQARRGPLLGHLLQGDDYLQVIRHRFLSLPYEEALLLMDPHMISTGPLVSKASLMATVKANKATVNESESITQESGSGLELLQWPCETMGLWSDMALVLDTWDRVLVWKGSELHQFISHPDAEGQQAVAPSVERCAAAYQACRQAATAIRMKRFPTPEVLEFTEGEPMARFLLARLIPSHKDPPDEQVEGFSLLSKFPRDEMEALCMSFNEMGVDDHSLRQYLRGVKDGTIDR